MYQLQRHVLAEIAKVAFLAFLVATLILTFGMCTNVGMRRGLPVLVTLHLLPSIILETLQLTLPFAVLFGVCSVFGKMAAEGELTAVISMGVHPHCLYLPAIWFAILLSFASFFSYEVCARWARPAMQRIVVEACDEIAYNVLRRERVLHIGQFSIAVKGVEQRDLIGPRIHFQNGSSKTFANAETAKLHALGQTGILRFECQDLEIGRNGIEGAFPRFVVDVPFGRPRRKFAHQYKPAELPASLLEGQIQFEQEQIQRLDQRSNDSQDVRAVKQRLRHTKRLSRLRAEFARRMANGFAVLAFTLIGIPVAVRNASTDNMTTFFFCVLPIALVYYPLLVAGETLARNSIMPEYSVWLASGTLMTVGTVLLAKWARN